MDLQLDGKRAFVSGSTKGIGYGIAKRLALEGASVTVNGRSESTVNEAVESIRDEVEGGDVSGVAADLSTPDGAEKVIDAVPEVEVLVNNVGIYEAVPFEETSDDDWLDTFQVNVMSGVRITRHYFPQMLEKNEGRIIFISSDSGLNIPGDMIPYAMTKSCQLAIARGLAERTKGTDVTVNSVLPGPTNSDGIQPFLADFAEERGYSQEEAVDRFIEENRPTSIIQRLIDPDEIATTVAYLASPHSGAINGAPVRTDGGLINSMA